MIYIDYVLHHACDELQWWFRSHIEKIKIQVGIQNGFQLKYFEIFNSIWAFKNVIQVVDNKFMIFVHVLA